MCWPLTRQWRPHSDDKGDREAAATWRAGGREAEECLRKGAASEAVRGHDRRSPTVESQGDGRMPQAPNPKPQAGPRSPPARHGRADATDEARQSCSERPRSSQFTKVEEDHRVGFETVLTLTRLSASRRPTTPQMVAEHRGRPNGLRGRGEPSWDRRCEIVEVLYVLSRVSTPSLRWIASHVARDAYPSVDTAPHRVGTQRQSCVPVRSRMRNVASIL